MNRVVWIEKSYSKAKAITRERNIYNSYFSSRLFHLEVRIVSECTLIKSLFKKTPSKRFKTNKNYSMTDIKFEDSLFLKDINDNELSNYLIFQDYQTVMKNCKKRIFKNSGFSFSDIILKQSNKTAILYSSYKFFIREEEIIRELLQGS